MLSHQPHRYLNRSSPVDGPNKPVDGLTELLRIEWLFNVLEWRTGSQSKTEMRLSPAPSSARSSGKVTPGVDVAVVAARPHADQEPERTVTGTREGGAHRLPNAAVVVGGDFAGDDDPPACGHHLHRHPGGLVVVEDVVEDLIGDLIGQLVRMTSAHGLGSMNSRHKHTRFHETQREQERAHPSFGDGRQDQERRLGASLQQLLGHLVIRRGAGIVGGAGSAHDLENLIPIHIRLLTKRLRHGDEWGGDRSTGRRMLA